MPQVGMTYETGVLMPQKPQHHREYLILHLVIFLTGFTFLIYEVSWNRLLSLALGTTVTAATIVLAAFMAGFGAGAYYWGNVVHRTSRTGKLLAILVGGIGVLSAVDYFLIKSVIPALYQALAGLGTGLVELLVFVIAGILLFLPAFLMGGIFPIVSKIAIRSDEMISSSLGSLYALETLGSTVGGLAAGFVFLGALGQMNTVMLAVVVNVLLGGWLYLGKPFIEREVIKSSASTASASEVPSPKSRHGKPNISETTRKIALVCTFACGFAILALQVLWLRMFRIYFTNTSYTFALIASLVILGLFVGSVMFSRLGRRITDYPRAMLRAMLYMAVLTAAGLVILIYLPQTLMFPFQSWFGSPLARVLLLPLMASLFIVVPPAIFSGYAFPLACRMYAASSASVGKEVGLVLAVNTLGCVIGPLLAAFVLLPLLGAATSVLLILVLLIGAGLYLLHHSKSNKLIRGALYLIALALMLAVVIRPDIKILPPSFSQFDREVMFYRESVEGTLSVGQDRGGRSGARYTFVNNSAVIGSSYDAIKVVKMVGHLPFLIGSQRKSVLVIGFGIGVTTSAIASHKEVESIECVELVSGLKDAARFYSDLNQNIASDPRLKIISGDGRHYLQLTPKKYDLISCDPTHPILGSGNLYTRDYFELVKNHLNPGGVVSQYLPLHKLRTKEFLGIIKTFQSVFPNCTVWLGHYHAVLLGSTEPIQIDFAEWSARVNRIGQDPNFYVEPYHLAATLVLDGATIERLGAGSAINTDNRSYTEFFATDCLDEGNLPRNLRFLMDNRSQLGAVFGNMTDSARMDRFAQGNRLLTESLFYQLSGDNSLAQQSLREAVRVNPEDQEFSFLMRLYYGGGS